MTKPAYSITTAEALAHIMRLEKFAKDHLDGTGTLMHELRMVRRILVDRLVEIEKQT